MTLFEYIDKRIAEIETEYKKIKKHDHNGDMLQSKSVRIWELGKLKDFCDKFDIERVQ